MVCENIYMQLGQLCPPGFCQMPEAEACVLAPHHPTVPHLEQLRASRQTMSSGSAPVQHKNHLPWEGAWAEGTPCSDISPHLLQAQEAHVLFTNPEGT